MSPQAVPSASFGSWLQPQGILKDAGLLSRFLFSEEKLFGAGVDNSVGGVVSGHHEVVGTTAPVSVTN